MKKLKKKTFKLSDYGCNNIVHICLGCTYAGIIVLYSVLETDIILSKTGKRKMIH